jgi:hypothetical protein
MITCQELVEALDDFLADRLPPAGRLDITHRLLACSPCVHFVES